MAARHRLAFLLPLILLTAAPSASPWGAFRGVAGVKITDTHQQILRSAFGLLMQDPMFRGMGIPVAGGRFVSFENIVQFEGVEGDPRTLSPRGPGPDAEGMTLYSCHWFNPATGQGLGPQSAADWYLRFFKAAVGIEGGDEEICKGLAWSAHFLADMFVPYHLFGLPAGEALSRISAGNFILGPTEAGPAYFIDPAPPAPPSSGSAIDQGFQQARNAVSAWWRTGWGLNYDFRETFAVFATNHQAAAALPVNHLDWFDPWYWNGDGSRSVFSSHASYEALAHGRFIESGGFRMPMGQDPIPVDSLWINAAPDYAFAGTAWQSQASAVQDFAAKAAARTLQNAELCWRQPEIAIRASVVAVYTLWRSAYTALEPTIQAGRDPARPNDGLMIQVHVNNHAYEASHDASVRVTVQRGGAVISRWVLPVNGPVTYEGGGQVGWFAPVNPNEEWTIVAEVVGIYDKTPDLQYGITTGAYKPEPRDPIQQVFEQPRAVEEARVEDFAGEYSIGDPTRPSDSYNGTLTLRPDGTLHVVEFVQSQRVEGEGTWYFERQSLYFSIKSPSGGDFSGTIQGTTADFTVTGHWSNGTAGTLRVYRRR
jgi:hypothetical protein